MRTFFHLACMALLCTATACEKPTEPPQPDPPPVVPPQPPVTPAFTKTSVVGTYVVTKVERNASGQRRDITTEWFNSYAGNCAKDDVTEFKPDNSMVVRDASVVCDESTDDTGTWDIVPEQKLRLDADTAVVEAFTTTTLRIVHPLYSTAQSQTIFTYTRQ